jgi:hypothetical protein
MPDKSPLPTFNTIPMFIPRRFSEEASSVIVWESGRIGPSVRPIMTLAPSSSQNDLASPERGDNAANTTKAMHRNCVCLPFISAAILIAKLEHANDIQ